MLADAGTPGNNRDVHQVEVPEAAQLCPARDGDVEGGPQLDGPAHAGRGGRLVGGVNGVGDILGPFDLGTEEVKKLFCLSIDAPGKLDLLHNLVCTVIQFLLGGDNAEQVQDECQQEHCYEDEHHRTEIVDITILTFQYGCRVLAGPVLLGGCPAGCFGHSVRNCLWQSKTTAFLTKTAVSRNGKRLLYIFLTVPSIAWMPLRGKSRTVPMLCRWCANFYFLKKNQQIWGNEYSRFIWEK